MDPPTCGSCVGYDAIFDARTARRELRAYQRRGPRRTTRALIEGVAQDEANGASLLDVGGGIGAVAHEIAKQGAAKIRVVDGSSNYLQANEREAARQGYRDRATYHLGDFVAIAPSVPEADFVTLDRVVCCYADMPGLLGQAASKARRRLGLVLPRDDWWVRAMKVFGNFFLKLLRSPFRSYVHPLDRVSRVLEEQGLRRILHERGLVWQVDVYERNTPPAKRV